MRYLLYFMLAMALSITMRRGKRYTGLRWKLMRALITERDGNRCRMCGAKANYGSVWLEVHHKKPLSKGGSNSPFNLVTLCNRCHTEVHKPKRKRTKKNPILWWILL